MSAGANKAVIERLFHEALDHDHSALIPEMFVDGGMGHYPGRGIQVKAGPGGPPRNTTTFGTDVHDPFGEGDNVVARITHHVTFGPGAE